jgi:hypothetical protein
VIGSTRDELNCDNAISASKPFAKSLFEESLSKQYRASCGMRSENDRWRKCAKASNSSGRRMDWSSSGRHMGWFFSGRRMGGFSSRICIGWFSSGSRMDPCSSAWSEIPSSLKRRSRATIKICWYDFIGRNTTQAYRFEIAVRVDGPFLDHEAGALLL